MTKVVFYPMFWTDWNHQHIVSNFPSYCMSNFHYLAMIQIICIESSTVSFILLQTAKGNGTLVGTCSLNVFIISQAERNWGTLMGSSACPTWHMTWIWDNIFFFHDWAKMQPLLGMLFHMIIIRMSLQCLTYSNKLLLTSPLYLADMWGVFSCACWHAVLTCSVTWFGGRLRCNWDDTLVEMGFKVVAATEIAISSLPSFLPIINRCKWILQWPNLSYPIQTP